MHSQKDVKDHGMRKALQAGIQSPHPYTRSVVSNYERYRSISNRSKDMDYWTEGEIPFGFIEDGTAPRGTVARLKLKDLNRHCLIVGPSGVGKSNLGRVLANELMDHIPIMIFDRTGDHVNAYQKKKPLIFPIRNLRINPNEEPPGVPYDEWLEIFSSVLINSLMLTDVSKSVCVQLIKYSNRIFKGKKDGLRSSIYEQRLAINRLKPRTYRDQARMGYWSRLEDRYDGMITSALGEIFQCYRGHDLVSLLNERIIFDCKGVSSKDLRVLIPIIQTKISCYRLYNDQGGEPLHATIIEEAENIYGIVGNRASFIEDPIDDLTRRIRGRGEILIVLNQTYCTLRTALRSNVYVQFMMGATNATERSEMGRSIGLREDQWGDALRLNTPIAFVSLEGKDPLLVSIPEYKMK